MTVIRLKVKREGSLLSQEINREITEDQLEAIRIVLDDDQLAFAVREDARITTLMHEEAEKAERLSGS
jgi:hypothetical protein